MRALILLACGMVIPALFSPPLAAQVDTAYVDQGLRIYELLPISVTAQRTGIGLTEASLGREHVGQALEKAGLNLVRRGVFLASDVYFDGFKRGDVEIVIDGERYPNSCPSRMDPPLSRVNPLEIQSLTVDRSTTGLQAGIGGTVAFHRSSPAVTPRIVAGIASAAGAGSLVDIGLAAEARRLRLTGRVMRGSPYVDGDGLSFVDRYGYVRNAPYGMVESSAHYAKGRFEAGASFSDTEDIPFPYLHMDERFNRLWSGFVALDGYRVYANRTHHLMDNGLRTDWINMPMESDVTNFTLGLTGDALEVYYRRWDGWNTMAPGGAMSSMMPTAQHLLPEIGSVSATVRGEVTRGKLNLAGRVGTQRVWIGDEERLAFYQTLYPDAARGRWFIPFAAVARYSGLLSEDVAAGFEAEFGTRPPVAEELFIALRRPMGKPHWVGNPTLGTAKRLSARGALSSGAWSTELFSALVFDYPALVPVSADQMKWVTHEGVRAALAGVKARVQTLLVDVDGEYNLGQNLTADAPLAEIAPLRGSIRTKSPEWRGFTATFSARGATAQDRVDADLGEERTPSWYRLDLGLGFRSGPIDLSAEVENLLDRTYVEHLSYLRNPYSAGLRIFEPGRLVRLSLSVQTK